MQTPQPQQGREDLESQVWNAIAAFEQIVETIPDDRVSLEALSHAYEQVGDLTRAREYLTRLATVIIEEQDREAAELVRERLVRFAETDGVARETLARVEAFIAAGRPAVPVHEIVEEPAGDAAGGGGEAEQRSVHVAAELSMAWTLFQAGELSQEDYAAVAQDISEISTKPALVTVSVLHVLHDRGHRSLERIAAHVARETSTPLIPLSLFDVSPDTAALLPRDVSVRFGVMVFAQMGKDVLVALLNPYNKTLRARVETVVGRPCHFYLTLPAEFDLALEQQAEKTKAKPAG
jgi:hypothetical protein